MNNGAGRVGGLQVELIGKTLVIVIVLFLRQQPLLLGTTCIKIRGLTAPPMRPNMSEPLTREQPPARFMIPRHFSYTRFNNENVEVVLATDYDALQAKLEAVDSMCQKIGCTYRQMCEQRDIAISQCNKAEQQLAETQAKLAACERSLQTMRDVNDHDARYQEELEAKLAAVEQERQALKDILAAILHADERGQGLPFQEAMERARQALRQAGQP